MTYLLDTDTCVFWLRGHVSVRDRLIEAREHGVYMSVITEAELRFGAASSSRPDANHEAIDRFAIEVASVGIDAPVATRFGAIKAELRRQGTPLADFDLLIAATALSRDLTLVTNNTAHFTRIPDLRLENWVLATDSG